MELNDKYKYNFFNKILKEKGTNKNYGILKYKGQPSKETWLLIPR